MDADDQKNRISLLQFSLFLLYNDKVVLIYEDLQVNNINGNITTDTLVF